VRYIKTPPVFQSKSYTGACFTDKACRVQFLFGLESFRYLYQGAQNVTIPLATLRSECDVIVHSEKKK
jgi:hypothetical protein